MVEETCISLSEELRLTNTQDLSSRRSILNKELNKNINALQQLMVGYYYLKRGKVGCLRWEESSITFSSPLKGSFVLHYEIEYTAGCQDLIYSEKEKMPIEFTITEKLIHLTGEFIPERFPDEF